MIKGKQGRFRENLLGKRVDYSARSVIVVGPRLKMHQCGLPKKVALELYQPFIIRKLKELGHADTIKSAKKMLERKDEEVWDILEAVIRNHPVMLNRAPTLHRMGIQAFEPTLVEGNAINLHPLACKGFNADFDGDQMAVHLPLSIEAQVEAHTLMLATNNIFGPANGKPIMSPSQDIVMGCYFVSMMTPGRKGEGMTFSSMEEADLAYAMGIIDIHAKIKVRLPVGRSINSKDDTKEAVGGIIDTSVGRVLFNMMLPEGMDYYNIALRSGELAQVISDCYASLGRRATIDLLDDMKALGFRESTKSGLSFATDDLVTPESKTKIIAAAEKQVLKFKKLYDRGIITDMERYNQVLDQWTHAREQITAEMMSAMETDYRGGKGYINPVYLMAHSGARGGTEQIRQLAGMRGLMAKPSGAIIETPIKANFREGLSVLEYFSSTHGARKGLADTALKTADSGYLTRKLADVAQNVVVTQEDCGTTQGITKGVIYRGEKVEVGLADAIIGRVSRQNIVNPVTDEVIVSDGGLVTLTVARKIEQMGLERIQVRSPMTCEASLGVCRRCYGMDMSTGSMVEEGMAVGIIGAQSIGEPGTQLTMRTFHIGGVAQGHVEDHETKCKKEGTVRFMRMRAVKNADGQNIVLTRNSEISICDPKGREIEKFDVPTGATLKVDEGEEVKSGAVLCEWDPHSIPVLSEVAGKVRYEDVVDGETMRVEKDPGGHERMIITDHKGERQPQIVIEDADGKPLDVYYLPERAYIDVLEGDQIAAGTVVAKTPREASSTSDITGGLPRVTEIFEARKPKEPSVIAEVDGTVEILSEKKRGKRTIIVRSETGIEREHLVPQGKRFLVHTGDLVKAGQSLIEGPLVPHDILRISGEEAVQQYLVHEVQSVYRSQRVEINDKHIETIIARMLRKVKIENPGDTSLLPGAIMDKFDFRAVNENLSKCLKISHKGDSDFNEGDIVPKDVVEQANTQIEALGGDPAKGKRPKFSTASTQLLGITKAAVQSSSFISAASFQETTKVLTEAALAGKTDDLVGLKENVILGHLIPAGTGFRSFQESEVRINPEALEALAAQKVRSLEEEFPLLQNDGGGTGGDAPAAPAGPSPFVSDSGFSQQPAFSPDAFVSPSPAPAPAGSLDQLLGGGEPATSPASPELAPSSVAPSAFAATEVPVQIDDLTKVEGIGPKVAEALAAAGITSYTKLSATDPERIKEILGGIGGMMATMDPSTWPAQGQMAAEGRWEDLQRWQDELDGGRGPAVVAQPDDLTKIEGIGPKVAEALVAAGITTYPKLSATDPVRIKEILAGVGGMMATMDPGTWPAQGQMAAEGRWGDLQKWQDELDGGRPAVAAAPTEPDDLTKIEGIGPKVAETLASAGILTYTQLSGVEKERLRVILASAGGIMATMNPDTWPAQGQMAAEGRWEDLQKWQDELDGGV